MKTPLISIFTLSVLTLGSNVALAQTKQTMAKPSSRPNFVMIVADDMGFSDARAFGGEISTPNLDELAEQGTRYSNFYVAPTCSPTRAMLMTGFDSHLVGLGNMYEYTAPNQLNQPGYEGVLSLDYPTLPQLLKDDGYHTYMAGKWHLGKSREHLPHARGFERSFSMLSGAGGYFSMKGPDEHTVTGQFSQDGEYLKTLPPNYYATRTFTGKIIEFIESNRGDGKPFLAYLAHQAPHDPLMVPDEYLRKYKGKFDSGWDNLRAERIERMKAMGIMPLETTLGERLWYVPSFDKLKPLAQVVSARKMEIFAAVVEYMDHEIGRLITYLREEGFLENTYVLFFSDNGPDPNDKAASAKKRPATEKANFMAKTYVHGFQNWGRKGSFTAYGPSWAQVSATPFNGLKYTTYEGGIRSPLIVVTPHSGQQPGDINTKALMHVTDIAPTLLSLAGVKQPSEFNGHPMAPMQGKSWVELLSGRSLSPRSDEEFIGTELYHGMAIRKAAWKIVWMPSPLGTADWQLFDLSKDPGERKDLSRQYPDKRAELINHWQEYARDNKVVLPNRSIYDGLDEQLPPRPPVYSPDFGRGSERTE